MKDNINNIQEQDRSKLLECRHQFELSKIDLVATGQETTGIAFFYKKVAYVICPKCGEVRQSDI